MKTIQFMNYRLATFLVAFVLLFASCDNPIFDPGGEGNGNGKPKDPPPTDCSIKGTMVRVPCAFGIYGDLWIKTDNGKYLQPCEQSFMTLVAMELKDGDRVEFGYKKEAKSLCDDTKIRCQAALPMHESVTINCLRVISTQPIETCPQIVVDFTNYGENGIQILESSMEGSLLKLKVGYGGCAPIESKDFSLSWRNEFAKSNPPQTTLQLFSAKVMEGIACDAYFTTELCFDVAAIRATVKTADPIQLNIGEHQILFK